MTPLHVSRDHSTSNISKVVKDIRIQLPSNGRAYFASRYLNSGGMKVFKSHNAVMEVLFNYHGQFQQLESDDGLFENFAFDDICDVGSSLPASALFSINVSIEGGLTRFTFSWNKFINHQNLIRNWMAQVDYKGLDELQDRILPAVISENKSSIIDVYPCAPMVDGMLLSQIRDPGAYKTLLMYEMRHFPGKRPLDVAQLANAWQAIIVRHPALRSVFFEGVDKITAYSQAVLKSHQVLIRKLPQVNYQRQKPPHRLVLCGTGEDSAIICQIEMSHTIIDGASTSILLSDWSKAYSGALDVTPLFETNRNFVRALKANSLTTKLAYWKKKLAGFILGLHDQVLEDLDFQHCSLADIQHDLRLSPDCPLFNTIVSFQNEDVDAAKDVNVGDLVFIDMDHENPTEQLEDVSNKLAYKLLSLGVSVGNVVPFCFDKSRWTPVAILAVMKAGGINVALDISLPEDRLRIILQQLKPPIILSSSSNAEMAKRLTMAPIFVVDEASVTLLKSISSPAKLFPKFTPSSIVYIILKSSSTGTPKEFMISYGNFASATWV
ncbi:putative NRPS-like protein biosynthetic cluster [Claviceps cyperi]|nr:putative NRPS-like protein biosynthetic cluster [Claviceps cyperi]